MNIAINNIIILIHVSIIMNQIYEVIIIVTHLIRN